ncbi:hypothetical protein Bhyg_00852 [Pseudolycoriella hygida]|uniref:Chitin-binding type-2 domain-containing protein n=1 Tax=Pseudolycoriella hygida TaxID=35572 RepID=A0A9Q0N8F8_9DIPT|nr:hypothetical protein Bhyg_00852 [Pseudolycoriella hygida]
MLHKIIFCVVLVVCSVKSINAQIYAEGTILSDESEFVCNRSGPQCADDCTTLMLCAAESMTPFANVSCAKSTPSLPYCVSNTCSSTPGNCSSALPFRCTSAGVFPDPNDCRRYRHCNESNAESTAYICPLGFVFNSKINLCEFTKSSHHSSKICNTVDCSRKTNEVAEYKPNRAFFSFCFVDSDGVRETIMFKCENEEYEIYDVSKNMCTFNCKKSGYYQDPSNCENYYVCSPSSGGFKAEKIPCPTGYYFDGTKCTKDSSKCIPGSLMEDSTEE